MKQTKVAFFSKWHVADGTSVLAELIGRELAKECDLTIFAPINDVKPVHRSRIHEIDRRTDVNFG